MAHTPSGTGGGLESGNASCDSAVHGIRVYGAFSVGSTLGQGSWFPYACSGTLGDAKSAPLTRDWVEDLVRQVKGLMVVVDILGEVE